jgi:RNA polymerase sigma-70 factor (ECF subfamily)
MNAHAHSLSFPAELPYVQEAEPRMDRRDELLERGWARWSADLARLAAALGTRRERQEDVLQDVYLTAREKCPAGLGENELRLWLFRVTANRCRLEHRRQKRWGEVLGVLAFWRTEAGDETKQLAEQNELAGNVEAALGRLKQEEREIVVLRYFCNFDSRQIGELLSLPDSTVRSRLAKARKQLARDLVDWR